MNIQNTKRLKELKLLINNAVSIDLEDYLEEALALLNEEREYYKSFETDYEHQEYESRLERMNEEKEQYSKDESPC